MTKSLAHPVDSFLRFDGKRTRWRVRANTSDGRYTLCTASMFGKVHYTIVDWSQEIRGAMNVIGGGLGIFTTQGDDAAIDDAVAMLEGRWEVALGTWEVSYRNRVPLRLDS